MRGEEQQARGGRDGEGALDPGASVRRPVSGLHVPGRGASFRLGPKGNVEREAFGRRPPGFPTNIRRVAFLLLVPALQPARNSRPGAELGERGPWRELPQILPAVGSEQSVPLKPADRQEVGCKKQLRAYTSVVK